MSGKIKYAGKEKIDRCRLCGDYLNDENAGFATLDLCDFCETEIGRETEEEMGMRGFSDADPGL